MSYASKSTDLNTERTPTAVLVLGDRTVFHGFGIGVEGETIGEVCFNTSMTGYQESLTDPSFAGQLITFTFPHIGNVGFNDEEIQDYMFKKMKECMFNGLRKASDCPASRFHELAESFGFLDEMKKCTTFKSRKRLMGEKILACFRDNEVRIRDVELGIRFGTWIAAYLGNGNLAALKNIATLKIVSYENKAIYSIKEELI